MFLVEDKVLKTRWRGGHDPGPQIFMYLVVWKMRFWKPGEEEAMTRDPGLSSSLRPSAVSLNFTESLYLKRQDGEVQTETIVNNREKISPTEGKVYQVKVHWNLVKPLKPLIGFATIFCCVGFFLGHRFKKRATAFDILSQWTMFALKHCMYMAHSNIEKLVTKEILFCNE
jgi:hypothetical protein